MQSIAGKIALEIATIAGKRRPCFLETIEALPVSEGRALSHVTKGERLLISLRPFTPPQINPPDFSYGPLLARNYWIHKQERRRWSPQKQDEVKF